MLLRPRPTRRLGEPPLGKSPPATRKGAGCRPLLVGFEFSVQGSSVLCLGLGVQDLGCVPIQNGAPPCRGCLGVCGSCEDLPPKNPTKTKPLPKTLKP